MKYAKSIAAVFVTVVGAIVAAQTDNVISNSEWVNVAIAGIGACLVFAAPNVPGAMYTKSIIAAAMAGLQLLASFISDGVTGSEWMQIGIAAAGAVGVFAVPNSTNEVMSAKSGARRAVGLILIAALYTAGLATQTSCGPPSRETLLKFQTSGQQLRQLLDVNESLPEELLAKHVINDAQFALLKVAQKLFSEGVNIYNETIAKVLSGELKLKVIAPIVADLIAKLRALKSLAGNVAQTVLSSLEAALRFAGNYFALQIAKARSAGYGDRQICRLVGLPYDKRRFELLAAGV